MKPHKVTPEEVLYEIQDPEFQADVAQSIAECGGSVPPFLMPVFSAGHWLGCKLKEHGMDASERESVCTAAGQRMCMSGPDNAHVVSAQVFNQWIDGQTDTPGYELARKLIDGEE